jgi:hypothetical protein
VKRTIVIVAVLIGLGWYADRVAHEVLVRAMTFGVYAVALALVVAVVAFLVFFVLSIRERVLTKQANRRLVQREADVLTVVNNEHGVFVREMNPRAVWRPLHLEASSVEMTAWQTWTLRNRPNAIKEMETQLLPPPAQVDLMAALDNVQRGLIVGASDAGKTTLLQWVVARRLQTSKVIVIDPHGWPGKWPGDCVIVGTGRDYGKIDNALDALVRLMTKRYDEIGKGLVAEMSHDRITILIDEWRAIVGNVGKPASEAIKALLTESRKAAFSVFVASHSDRAKPLGLEGEYDLKDGFAVVKLSLVNGQRVATIDTGDGPIPATLPGPFRGSVPQVLGGDEFINLEVEPSPTEAYILNLKAEGLSNREVSQAVWGEGKYGQFYNQKIEAIVSKYGEK